MRKILILLVIVLMATVSGVALAQSECTTSRNPLSGNLETRCQ